MSRIHFALVVIAGAVLLLSGAASSAELYKWVDKDGVTHVQDHAFDVPAGTAVEKRAVADEGASAAKPAAAHQVEIYTMSTCHYCHAAKEYLNKRGIPFTEHDVEKEPGAAKRRDELSPQKGVPIAVIDGKVVRGFSVEIYDSIFGKTP